MAGIAWHDSIQMCFAGLRCENGKKRKRVYWLSTLCVILKCNHNPNWAYLLHIQYRHRAGATGDSYLLIFR